MILIPDFFQCSTMYLASLIQQYCLYREWQRHLDELHRMEKPPANNRANFEASSAFSRVYERTLSRVMPEGHFQSYIRVYTSFFLSITSICAIVTGVCDNVQIMFFALQVRFLELAHRRDMDLISCLLGSFSRSFPWYVQFNTHQHALK